MGEKTGDRTRRFHPQLENASTGDRITVNMKKIALAGLIGAAFLMALFSLTRKEMAPPGFPSVGRCQRPDATSAIHRSRGLQLNGLSRRRGCGFR